MPLADYLTVAEAAAILSVSPWRVYKLIETERLPATKHGRDWLLDRTAVEQLRQDREREPPRAGRPAKT